MVFWTVEQPKPEKRDYREAPDDAHDFDDILSARTPTSWDEADVLDVFEFENDVSPDSSVGNPEDIKEDVKACTEEPSSPNTVLFSFFPWPFTSPDDTTTVEAPRRVQDTVPVVSSAQLPPRRHNEDVTEVPFDERIPLSDGVEVPFDECPLSVDKVESSGPTEPAHPSSTARTPEEESENYGIEYDSIEQQHDESPNGSQYECLEKDDEEEHSDKENVFSSDTLLTERPQMGLSSGRSLNRSSIDALVSNLEAVARRMDALSDEIEECRTMDSASLMMQQSTSIDHSESLNRTFLVKKEVQSNVETHVDEIEECRSEDVAPLIQAPSDGIEECRSLDSASFVVKRTSSIEYTESLIRKLSKDRDCLENPEDEIEEYLSGDVSVPKIREGKVFHPPSTLEKPTRIAKDIDNLEDPSFDEIQEIRTIDTANSILETIDETAVSSLEKVHELETIEPPTHKSFKKESSEAPTPSRDEASVASSKKVSFAEELYETCPSSTSDLAFDYMHHDLNEEDGKVKHKYIKDSQDMYDDDTVDEESVDDDSLFEVHEYGRNKQSPWFSFLVQAK